MIISPVLLLEEAVWQTRCQGAGGYSIRYATEWSSGTCSSPLHAVRCYRATVQQEPSRAASRTQENKGTERYRKLVNGDVFTLGWKILSVLWWTPRNRWDFSVYLACCVSGGPRNAVQCPDEDNRRKHRLQERGEPAEWGVRLRHSRHVTGTSSQGLQWLGGEEWKGQQVCSFLCSCLQLGSNLAGYGAGGLPFGFA